MGFPGEETMAELLRDLVETESPTGSHGVRRVAERVARELEGRGAKVSFRDGDHLRADLPGEGEPLLVLAHSDTVWPEGTLRSMPFRIDGDRAFGPGVLDMKAGIVVLVAALEAGLPRRAVRVVVTADEEQGSETAAAVLAEAAAGVVAALVVEPPMGEADLTTARRGIGRFRLRVAGRAAHSGRDLGEGASAVEELAHQTLALHRLNEEEAGGASVNVGVVRGGTAANVVAAEAEALVDVRVTTPDDIGRVEAALARLEPAVPGTSLDLDGDWTRPPLERSDAAGRLFAKAREHGAALGLDLRETSSGGGSDGNLVGAHGVPVLDGLGAVGAGAHAPDEHVLLPSLPVRARLLAAMLRDPGL